MKILKYLTTICLIFAGLSVYAEPYKVVVIPTDLFNVCNNYYCFDEPSEIIANDVIKHLNQCSKISAPTLYEIRNKVNSNPQIKTAVSTSLDKYKNSDYIDFANLKKISNEFNTKSILLISSNVDKRSIWEILEISSVFEAEQDYTLNTKAVLLDNVNDVVMWSGHYTKKLGDNSSRFWAKSTSQALSQYEKIRSYSKDIVSRTLSQNILQRFLAKTINRTPTAVKAKSPEFRPNALENIKIKAPEEYGEIQSEIIYSF